MKSQPVSEARAIESLRPHPENAKIYGDAADQSLIDSVTRLGVLVPLLITPTGIVISGHRRWVAAKRAGLSQVPVIVFPSEDDLDVIEALIESNRQRAKDNEQVAREVQMLHQVEHERAQRRKAAGQRAGGYARHGIPPRGEDAEPDGQLGGACAAKQATKERGKTRRRVARKVGVGDKKADQLRLVIDAIDRLTTDGEHERANRLKASLKKSARKAYKHCVDAGLIPTRPHAEASVQISVSKYVTVAQWYHLPAVEQNAALAAQPKGTFAKAREDSDCAVWLWDPITGCEHDCPYCEARDVAERTFSQRFAPTLIPERLGIPATMGSPPAGADTNPALKNVWVAQMGDLFGPWVPREWIQAVLDNCAAALQWNFLLLTKFPQRLAEFAYAQNIWVGTTVDCAARIDIAEDAFAHVDAAVKFVCCEPLLEHLWFRRLGYVFNWLIIGAARRSSRTPAWLPARACVDDLEVLARKVQVPIFERGNPLRRRQEFPGAREAEPELPAELQAAVQLGRRDRDATLADRARHEQPGQEPA